MAIDTRTNEQLRQDLTELANQQFESAEYRRLLAAHFTPDGARAFEVQRVHFVKNRRDCWGFVQGAAPLDVKRLIWTHEQEELMGEGDVPDHVTLGIQEAEQVGLPAGDFERSRPTEVAQTCFWAWTHLAKSRSWLEAIAASSILEWVVSDEIINGGGIVRRLGMRMEQDLGLPFREQATNAVHVVADVEHSNLLLDVAGLHVRTDEERAAMVRGARDSLAIERVWRGHQADLIAGLVS
ncbi:MAG TPA: iron-containing redox enzyme family protein [Chloroflexota bacterium]|nr:iron-containing redox enzyme family protein [Chloroflexota bacterium]